MLFGVDQAVAVPRAAIVVECERNSCHWTVWSNDNIWRRSRRRSWSGSWRWDDHRWYHVRAPFVARIVCEAPRRRICRTVLRSAQQQLLLISLQRRRARRNWLLQKKVAADVKRYDAERRGQRREHRRVGKYELRHNGQFVARIERHWRRQLEHLSKLGCRDVGTAVGHKEAWRQRAAGWHKRHLFQCYRLNWTAASDVVGHGQQTHKVDGTAGAEAPVGRGLARRVLDREPVIDRVLIGVAARPVALDIERTRND